MSPKRKEEWEKAVTSANSIAAVDAWFTSVNPKDSGEWETLVTLYRNGVLHRLDSAAGRALQPDSKEFQTLIKPNWTLWESLAKR